VFSVCKAVSSWKNKNLFRGEKSLKKDKDCVNYKKRAGKKIGTVL